MMGKEEIMNTKDDRSSANAPWIKPPSKFKRRQIVRPSATVDVYSILVQLPRESRDRIMQSYRMSTLEKLFRNEDIMATVDGFIKYGLNISETSRRTFMHRNSLMYRLNKIRDLTGLDIRMFECAQTFKILHILYQIREKEREEELARLAAEEKKAKDEQERLKREEEQRVRNEKEMRKLAKEAQERVVNNKSED